MSVKIVSNNELDYLIIICYLNVFNAIHGTKNSLKIHMNFVIKTLVNLYYY